MLAAAYVAPMSFAPAIPALNVRSAPISIKMEETESVPAPAPKGGGLAYLNGKDIMPSTTGSKSMTSQVLEEGLKRLGGKRWSWRQRAVVSDGYGVDLFEGGTGRGWDTSTEPKNRADVRRPPSNRRPHARSCPARLSEPPSTCTRPPLRTFARR